MEHEREPESGTLEEKDDAENGGTPDPADDADSGEVEGTVTISKGELGVWKSKAERVNALEKQVADLKAISESRTTTTDNVGSEADDQRKRIQKREQYLQRLEVAARAGNEDSEALLEVHRGALEAEQRTLYRLEMMDVDPDEREEVKGFMKKYGVQSPAVASQLLRGGDKYKVLANEVKRLQKELETKTKPSPKIEERVVGEPRSASSNKNTGGVETITLQEYSERMSDPARMHATKIARDSGKLKFKNR